MYYGCQNETQCNHPQWLNVSKLNLIIQYFINNKITSPYDVDFVLDLVSFITTVMNLQYIDVITRNDMKLFISCIDNTNPKQIYKDYGKVFKQTFQNYLKFIQLSNAGYDDLSKTDLENDEWYDYDRDLMLPLLINLLDL